MIGLCSTPNCDYNGELFCSSCSSPLCEQCGDSYDELYCKGCVPAMLETIRNEGNESLYRCDDCMRDFFMDELVSTERHSRFCKECAAKKLNDLLP